MIDLESAPALPDWLKVTCDGSGAGMVIIRMTTTKVGVDFLEASRGYAAPDVLEANEDRSQVIGYTFTTTRTPTSWGMWVSTVRRGMLPWDMAICAGNTPYLKWVHPSQTTPGALNPPWRISMERWEELKRAVRAGAGDYADLPQEGRK